MEFPDLGDNTASTTLNIKEIANVPERNIRMIKLLLEKIKKNHALAMILCCGIPLVGIMALSSLGLLGSWGYYALILLCPLGHIFMMRGMMHSNSKENMVPRQIEHKIDES